MKLIPYIDIIEPKRIDDLLADPTNFTWRAVDSETLDTWMPDFGLTEYPLPSIYRPEAVAHSGMSSTLRHRFWGTVEHQSDHVGLRYVGILIYAAAGEACPLEVRLADEDIGRVEPSRHDNRRHLIVLDKAVRFMGEMEVFQCIAPGPGTYRIEQFVLLSERPQPSRFIPEVRRLSVNTRLQPDGLYEADLHFITSETAAVQLKLEADGKTIRQLDNNTTAKLHHLTIDNLAAHTAYTASVTAREPAGETSTQTIEFRAQPQSSPPIQAVRVPLNLFNLADRDLTGLPLTFGLPLAQGMIYAPPDLQLDTAGEAQPVQARIHARWPDDSARWLLVDTVIPSALAEKRTIDAHLTTLSAPSQHQPGLTNESTASGFAVTAGKLRVSIEAHGQLVIEQRRDDEWIPILPTADGRSLTFAVTLGDGTTLAPGPIQGLTLEETGDCRAVLCFTVPHQDQDGVAHLQSTLRLHVYAGQSFIRLVHRLSMISPAFTPAAAGGDLANSGSGARIRGAIAGDSGEESTLLRLRSFALLFPWIGAECVHMSDQSWPLTEAGWQLTHEHDLAYEVASAGTQHTFEGRTNGYIQITRQPGRLALGVKNFWETYPKGLHVAAGGIAVQLFPELSGQPLPGDEDAWHRLYFWLRDGSYLLKAGMALTSEVLLDFDGTDTAAFDWLQNPVVVRPSIDYINQTGALNPIAPKAGSLLPDYETLADQALASFHQDRDYYRAFGQVNFGDWYGESGWSWGNNEYDPAYCAYVEFLRGGDPAWAGWGAQSVRHLVDVDTLNYSADPTETGGQCIHMPGHLGGYLPPLFRSKISGTKLIPSHTWVEGSLLHYLLTGDETVCETVEKTRQWLLNRHWFDHYDFSNCRESGWHIIHLCMLATALNDPDCLNAAAIIVQRVLEREAPGGGWVRMLTESHCGCGYPRCMGEAGFMVGVLLSGLKRYYTLTGDERVASAIVGGAHWLIDHTFDEKSGYFRYTSCAKRTQGGGFQQTQWVLEGLADAYEISGDPEIGQYVRDGLRSIGRFPKGVSHLGLGKAMSQQMRYVPTVLAALQKRPLEAVPS